MSKHFKSFLSQDRKIQSKIISSCTKKKKQ